MTNVDAIIIGTGVAASIVASELLSKGKRVLMLERGAEAPYAPMSHNETWHERTVPSIENQSIVTRNRWDNLPATFDDLSAIENENPDFRFDYNMRLGYGGSGAVWSGRTWRFYNECFQTKRLYGYGIDWPFSANELSGYYDQAEHLLHVSGPKESDWPWSENFRYNSFGYTHLDSVVRKIFGDKFRYFETANAVKNLPALQGGCVGAKTCVSFCPANALTRPHFHILQRYIEHRNLRIEFGSVVTSLETAHSNNAVSQINIVRRDKTTTSVSVPKNCLVFLCGNTIENLRICLHSSQSQSLQVANSKGLLGKFFASHGGAIAEIVANEDLSPGKSRPSTMAILQSDLGKDRSTYNSFIFESFNFNWRQGNPPKVFENARRRSRLWGKSLFDNARERINRSTMIAAIFEVEMRRENSVSLSKVRDRFGKPLAKIEFALSARDERTFNKVKEVFNGMNDTKHCKTSQLVGWGLNGNHPMGGYIMSKDPSEGVTDQYGRSWDHPNLYLTGGGLFCSTSPFNPTLTIAANTLRQLNDPRLGAA